MPKSKARRSKKNQENNTLNSPRVIKAGIYDGSQPSSSFVVSGHSTGAANTEMDALSHQVSIDAGAVPAYPTDDNYRDLDLSADVGQGPDRDTQDTPDLVGPILYGPEPSLLQPKTSRGVFNVRNAVALSGAAAFGFLAYKLYQNAKLREDVWDYGRKNLGPIVERLKNFNQATT